jgi:hypothetical protein
MSPHQFQATPALNREPRNYTPLSREAAKEDLYLTGVKPWVEVLDELLSTKPFAGRRMAA